ncbi:CDP-alcohol phosphatidyltransferase family protein [Donghicola sp. C2-DW-16]|uniref:CDP-alcohol phosphatidyltransferase family protein n=1 Tax=Donghicola mangrovi TaxID=2729614 RepID=A0ABX2PJQ8_9RHOB|nr:CDP-alcohol phosphatidyltransferase family protein [Donghicola mangrovi]NVO29405.1 CDP-alcohol phosphatidyltransferase family protein [Donghicola mangrovi]
MFDAALRPLIDPTLNRLGRGLARAGFSANGVTLAGLALGLAAAGCIAVGLTNLGLALMLASRLADGLDGAIARATKGTDFGGYLDITCDFLFYGAIPLGFVVLDPAANGLAGAFLLTSFYFNGASFLGYAILAEKHGMQTAKRGAKSLYFTGGILEGAETIGFFALICLWPVLFAPASYVFGALCFVTAISRILLARQVFGPNTRNEESI